MKLKVFGDVVPVVIKENLENMGEYHVQEKMIFIKAGLSKEEYNCTLIHEMFEAVYARCSFYQGLNNEIKEIFIDCLSKAVAENFELKLKSRSK